MTAALCFSIICLSYLVPSGEICSAKYFTFGWSSGEICSAKYFTFGWSSVGIGSAQYFTSGGFSGEICSV